MFFQMEQIFIFTTNSSFILIHYIIDNGTKKKEFNTGNVNYFNMKVFEIFRNYYNFIVVIATKNEYCIIILNMEIIYFIMKFMVYIISIISYIHYITTY